MFVRATGTNGNAFYIDAATQQITLWNNCTGEWRKLRVMAMDSKAVMEFLIQTARNIVKGTWEEIVETYVVPAADADVIAEALPSNATILKV